MEKFLKCALKRNWKTSAGGLGALVLIGLNTQGIEIPGFHIDPSSYPELIGLAILGLLGKDADVSGKAE